jgi:hypothetical protein
MHGILAMQALIVPKMQQLTQLEMVAPPREKRQPQTPAKRVHGMEIRMQQTSNSIAQTP